MQTEREPMRADRDRLETVIGRINFAQGPSTSDHRSVTATQASSPPLAGGGVSYDDLAFADHEVTIRNARTITADLSLDKEGFVVVSHEASSLGTRDPEAFVRSYVEEMTVFLRGYFKAASVTPVDIGGIALRSIGGNFFRGATTMGAPGISPFRHVTKTYGAGFAHTDYTPVTGAVAAAKDAELKERQIPPHSRMMIIQTWRVLSAPPQDYPLAFCDATTVAADDLLIAPQSRYGGQVIDALPRYNPSQKWYYLPHMTSDELYLFKGYDSAMHDRMWAPHAAFDNRMTYPKAFPRESVETRYYVYFD